MTSDKLAHASCGIVRSALFVDEDEGVLAGLTRAFRPRPGWHVETARTASAALESLERTRFDVVIVDARLPPVDGRPLLDWVQVSWPAAQRGVLTDETAGLHHFTGLAHHIFPKPIRPLALHDALEAALTARDEIRDRALSATIGRLSSLRLIPAAYGQISELLADPRSDMDAIALLVERDVGLATNVLRLVNSTWFALPTRVTSVRAAVRATGMNQLKSLVLMAGVFSGDSAATRRLRDEAMTRLAFVSALAGRLQQREAAWNNLATTAALLCDVALLALSQVAPTECAHVEDRVRSGATRLDAEVETFGADHAVVASMLLRQWGLPQELAQAILLHHAPHASPSAAAAVALATLVVEAPSRASATQRLPDLLELFGLTATDFETLCDRTDAAADSGSLAR